MSVTTEPAPPATRIDPRAALRRLAEGELGSLRVLIVLAGVWIFFALQEDSFLTGRNLTNLALQVAPVGLISVGVLLVLLLGEIDLSVAAVSGMCASIVAVLNVQHGWDPYLAMLAGLLAGTAVGLFQGTFVTRLGIPAFVVTIAGLMAWQGVQLKVLGSAGTINLTDPAITDLAGTFAADWLGWALAIGAALAIAAGRLATRRRPPAAGLELDAPLLLAVRIVAPAAALIAAAAVLNSNRGVPVSLLILVGVVVVVDALLTRTALGGHVYAAGGNREATRRAGIDVAWVRTGVFMAASALAAAGGILAAARLLAVNQSSGGSDLLLLAIAGPVIAGVSLYGGRGSVWAALFGAVVIGSISNGMDLMALAAGDKFIVTGAVLLAAVSLDALSRKRRRMQGRL